MARARNEWEWQGRVWGALCDSAPWAGKSFPLRLRSAVCRICDGRNYEGVRIGGTACLPFDLPGSQPMGIVVCLKRFRCLLKPCVASVSHGFHRKGSCW